MAIRVASGKRIGERRSHLIARTARSQAVQLLEALESRLLLSDSHLPVHALRGVASPTFILYGSATSRSANSSHVTPFANTSPTGTSPATMRQAYGVNQTTFGSVAGDGSGQTIAIIDAYNAPSIVGDLTAFDTQFGLPAASLKVESESGTSTLPRNAPGAGDSWALETSLDVEWAHAMAPGAKILLVEANSASDSDLFAAIDTARKTAGVSDVSMSWGGDEYSGQTSFDSYFTTPANHNGVTFIASAGDSGAYSPGTSTLKVEYPAVSPNVLGIGGTTLNTSGGAWASETVWGNGTSSGSRGGGGGGISTIVPQPSYQAGVVTQSTTHRTVPDVSFDANPNTGASVYDSYDISGGHWAQVGGTSLAAPMWAAVIAIADQGRVLTGQGTLDGRTQTLPKIYALPATDFHDITSGSNGYSAGTGYDLASGRGTPIVNKVVADLVGVVTPAPAIGSFAVNPSAVESGTSVTLTASNVAEINGAGTVAGVKFYRESNGTSGLQTAGTGADTLLAGVVTQNGTTWTITAPTTGLAGGSYTYYAVATDAAGVSSAAATATLTIVTPTIGTLTVNPTAVQFGGAFTLTASNVVETPGAVASVSFYRESNGTSGYQTTDASVGIGTWNGTAWTFATSATGLAAGSFTYYAVATDTAGISGAAASAALTVVSPTIGSFSSSPSQTTAGTNVTLTAANVAETNGSVSSVKFYRESNGVSGLQLTPTADTLIGTGTVSGSTWTIPLSTTGFANGTYTLYAVATDGVGVSTVAATTLVIGNPAPGVPINNNFASATVISGTALTVTGTNVGATKEAGEPNHANVPGGKSVWWNWTAPTSGKVLLNTHGSTFDTVLAVYTGNTVSTLTAIAADDDDPAGGTLTSAVTFNAVQGTTYHIAVDGYGGASGNITLNLNVALAPANDNFASATLLSGNSLTVTGTTVGATKQAGEPNHAGNGGGASIWFAWTATTTRTVSLNTHGSSFDTLLAVYTGGSVSSLSAVASNDDDPAGGTYTSALTFNAVAGTTYYFAVDGYNGASGSVVLNLT